MKKETMYIIGAAIAVVIIVAFAYTQGWFTQTGLSGTWEYEGIAIYHFDTDGSCVMGVQMMGIGFSISTIYEVSNSAFRCFYPSQSSPGSWEWGEWAEFEMVDGVLNIEDETGTMVPLEKSTLAVTCANPCGFNGYMTTAEINFKPGNLISGSSYICTDNNWDMYTMGMGNIPSLPNIPGMQ